MVPGNQTIDRVGIDRVVIRSADKLSGKVAILSVDTAVDIDSDELSGYPSWNELFKYIPLPRTIIIYHRMSQHIFGSYRMYKKHFRYLV